MTGGYLELVAIVGLDTLLVLWPPRRPRALAAAVFFVTHLVNELPGLALVALLAGTVLALIGGALASAGGLAVLALAALTALGLLEVTRRGLMAASVVERSLDEELGPGWRSVTEPAGRSRWHRLARDLLAPLPLRPLSVQLIRNVSYGEAGRRNRLNIYRRRGPVKGTGPVLVHFHGGHFQTGGKSREALPLLHLLASQGWVCISATYRLGQAGRFPNSLIDAKQVISWARSHAAQYGGDPSVLIVAGSSAGAHLASMAALTANDPAFQPGFADADTAVTAAVCLYGYYGDREAAGPLPSSPEAYVSCDAPPFLIAHGDNDVLIPIGHADHFVQRLRACSTRPVVYLRLPGAEHSFDLFYSPRFEAVIDGIQAFAAWVRVNQMIEIEEHDSAYHAGLADVLTRAFGVPAVLAETLRDVQGITAAYLYGSWAARHEGQASQRPVGDIDVLVLGGPDRDQLCAALSTAEQQLGRPVQATIRDRTWLEAGSGAFHDTITSRPMLQVPLPGD